MDWLGLTSDNEAVNFAVEPRKPSEEAQAFHALLSQFLAHFLR